MPARQPKRTYHHGELRGACIQAGLELLASRGKEGVSLREVARRCRVSPRAPYQHFADKTTFLAALAEVGFQRFGSGLIRAGDDLAGLARAYLEFATEHPALMQLMFGADFEDRAARNPALHRAALATFEQLEARIAPLHPGSKPRNARLLAVNAWALVHGLAELDRDGQLDNVLPSNTSLGDVLEVAVRLFSPSPTTSKSRSRKR